MEIGFIGIGKLGKPASEYFSAKGINVSTADKGDDIKECVMGKKFVFVAVPTPHVEEYDGKNVCSHLPPQDFDYSIVKSVLTDLNRNMSPAQCIVLISTVLPGTCSRELLPLVNNTNFLYNPYLISMGTVKEDMEDPEMIMIGGEPKYAQYLENFYKLTNPEARIVKGTYEEVESIKIFYNTFISMKISFVNMIQDVAMKLGNLDVDVVTTALANSTKRIVSSKYMKAGMGDGGSCHPRDNIALQWLSDELNLGYNLFGAIVYAREMQAKNLAKFLISLSKKHRLPITIIGRSFKPGVEYDDGSPAILVSNYIKKCNFDDFFY